MTKNMEDGVGATFANQVKAFNILTANLVDYGDRRVAYSDGWSDAKIASETNLRVAQVGILRRRNFGRLVMHPETKKRRSIRSDVTELKAVIADHKERIKILSSEVQALWKLLEGKGHA